MQHRRNSCVNLGSGRVWDCGSELSCLAFELEEFVSCSGFSSAAG